MATVLQPEKPTGEFRVPTTHRPAVLTPSVPTRRRLDHVDLLRGLVMVIMVLDHVRAYLSNAHFDPTDLARTDVVLFGTRWITHYCAPTFAFLAGASAWIAGTRRTRGELARFLATRGLWLILIEFTLITFGWYFTSRWTMGMVAQVIWAIGASMVVLAGLIYLPRAAIAGLGLTLVLGHNLLDGITPEQFGVLAPLWRLLHVPGPLEVLPLLVIYPLVPWVGVMALGYIAGPLVFSQDATAARRLGWIGALLIAGFVVLRTLNGYGDPNPRLTEGSAALLGMSFLKLTKYPPSLLFLMMTLGPALLGLSLLRHARGRVADILVTFGRVPFLFYAVHIYLVHVLAVAGGAIQGYAAADLRVLFLHLPEGYGFGLPVVYLAWIGLVVMLYPLCRYYAGLKARSRAWWLSYL